MDFMKVLWSAWNSVVKYLFIVIAALICFVFPAGLLYAKIIRLIDNMVWSYLFTMAYFILFCILLTKGGKFVLQKFWLGK